MKRILRPLIYIYGLLMLQPNRVRAQQQFDGAHSNYAGIGGVLWNPATVADNRYAIQLQIADFDAHGTNSAYAYTGPWSYLHPGADFNIQGTNATALASNQPRIFSVGFQLRGPGLLVRLGPKSGIALSTRVRTAFQGNDVSASLLQNSIEGFRTVSAWHNSSFNLNYNTVTERSLTYGKVLVDTGPHFLKVGLTGKWLIGLGAAYAQGNNIDYETSPSAYAGGNGILFLHQLQGAYGYSYPEETPRLDLQTARRLLLGQNATGSGWGGDVGFVYEYRPRRTVGGAPVNKELSANDTHRTYLYRLGVSVTDIGAITYRNNTVAVNNISLTDAAVQPPSYIGIDLSNYETRIPQIFQSAGTPLENHFTTGLPTALNVDFDYHFSRYLYLNASASQGLRIRYAIGTRTFSWLSVAPRLETRRFELAFPLSMTNNYRQFAAGAMLRLGPLVVGSNNLVALWSGANAYGANVYGQVSLLQILASKQRKRTARFPH
ncbi:DUF5723 family protein [Hymenobacter caeli]|uniref:DUF5723 domain-containing protein n=1 Tax=Hymenobacter caeli TaxID=2735894 RepID=A0ABX2FTB7_9BACT|nr:DUF5723 family protein [Hymenobacter caeli]NRT20088.1 hypothetical protein [Hymenobacter caeli]